MKAFFDERQRAHDPKHFMANGRLSANPEQPQRVAELTRGAKAANCALLAPADHGLGPIAEIHSPEYLAFLESIHARWIRTEGASEEVIPNIHPDRRIASYPSSAAGQAGFHQADTSCPIAAGTWKSAYWSAQTALSAADSVLAGEASAYALCRPPGHHAFGDLAGGFCFLNNSAIAAQALLRAGRRPAILDVDVHHGNGTQGIFYQRKDVLTVSIHADPARFYPFFWGHAEERGEGEGRGYNLNLPMPRGTKDAEYLSALDIALGRVRHFGADVLVLALGLDAHENDPFHGFSITTPGFAKIAGAISRLDLPAVIVQEGGYLSADLGDNLTSFLNGYQAK
ncbi:deacetylase, histone deacetylase/acetoin utilization protein [Hoeflea sp. IMCC20628]|uniref:histone deacetylase family protein n=1 Tax=Hoeflea sp. IMCC20628 TaxID=1620421 RepID=UPI00063AFF19|nr:histone deacetylase family protein [Hoeflea sp. IMCC20628]AKI01380.1 deacetylase, histone deacetylase/acetoin utilization protein [Hoeflea sp. IMCC20628]